MPRKACVAGKFYEGEKERLRDEIKTCFTEGPGSIPKPKKGTGVVKGVVVPHAGYTFSGRVAAHAYHSIAQSGIPDIVIIFGPNHRGIGSTVAIMTEGEWETPLGTVPISPMAKEFCTSAIQSDELAHRYEHSIEVQLPFLQYFQSVFSLIPVSLSWQDWETVHEIGSIFSTCHNCLFVASTDFSHVEFSGFPSKQEVEEQVHGKDMLAIQEILKLNPHGLVNQVERNSITMCGYGAVAAMLEALKKTATSARLLNYATSYDVSPGTYVVGYAAIAIM